MSLSHCTTQHMAGGLSVKRNTRIFIAGEKSGGSGGIRETKAEGRKINSELQDVLQGLLLSGLGSCGLGTVGDHDPKGGPANTYNCPEKFLTDTLKFLFQ